jgi:serine phosphatase RsbU (regulator of sigma subunit)/anti-sigma regulatory factor (Ser/Thr protein kinase)
MLSETLEKIPCGYASEFVAELLDALRLMIVPIAETLTCSFAIQTSRRLEWIVRNENCHCHSVGLVPAVERSCLPDRVKVVIPIEHQGNLFGTIELCGQSSHSAALEGMGEIVKATIKRLGLERQESLLLIELGGCLESLEALYETYSLAPYARNKEVIVDRILERAISSEDELKAGFWIELDGRLQQFVKGGSWVESSSTRSGAIAEAVTTQKWVVIDDLFTGLDENEIPSECLGSSRFLIAPVASSHGTRGALALWGPSGGKPFDSRIVRQTQALATQGLMAVEGERLYRAALENELLQQELEIGARMQQMLLIGSQPNPLGFARVASLVLPSQCVGGDFVEFFQHMDHCLDILIGDVMGKGLKSSLVGATVARQFHRTLCSLLSAQPDILPWPESIVSLVHGEIARILAEFDSFVTLDYARIDASRARFDFVDCGHTPILQYHTLSGRCQPLRGHSMPLGFSDRETYEQVSVSYDEGDIFIFYSDGVTEVKNPQGELFGLSRLIGLVESAANDTTPESLIRLIREALATFAKADKFDDDLTIVVVEAHIVQQPTAVTKAVTMEIRSELERLDEVRSFVRGVCRGGDYPPLSPERVYLLELAVTEAASNIMLHGYRGESDHWIRVEGEVSEECVLIRFVHSGEPFDPTSVPEPVFDGTREGGYGVYLIDQCVDEVFYVNNGRGINAITLIQKRQLQRTEE